MSTDIELLPLPNSGSGFYVDNVWHDAFIKRQMQDYALLNVLYHLDEDATEIEALRAEVEAWRELSDHVRAGACKAIWPDRYVDERIRDVAAALKRAVQLAEALRLIESAQRRGFGIDYVWGVVQSALRDHEQEVGNG